MYKSSLGPPAAPSLPQLPPYEFAKRLFAAQYIYIGTIFSFLQPHVFESRLQKMYSNSLDLNVRDDCLAFVQVLLIFAYGKFPLLPETSAVLDNTRCFFALSTMLHADRDSQVRCKSVRKPVLVLVGLCLSVFPDTSFRS